MKPKNKIPTIKPSLLDGFHFQEIGWIDYVPEYNHLFHISRLEHYVDKMVFPLPTHRKMVYDMIFLTQGTSIRSKGLNQYSFHENEVFFLPPYQITSHETLSKDVKGFFIHFSEEIFDEKVDSLKNFPFLEFLAHPIVKIPADKLESILYLYERIFTLYYTKGTNLKILTRYILVLLEELKQFAFSSDSLLQNVGAAARITEQYKNALTQYIYEKQTVRAYAQLLHVSPNYLNRCVKETISKTAQNLLSEMLILEAKSMLKYSNLSISEIAENLCKTSPSNFARFFKKQTGISPKDYIQGKDHNEK